MAGRVVGADGIGKSKSLNTKKCYECISVQKRICQRKPAGTPALHLIRLGRQTRDADAGVTFMADVQADQQGGDVLQDARILQFAAIDGADAGNSTCHRTNGLDGIRVVAANDHIAIHRAVFVQQRS